MKRMKSRFLRIFINVGLVFCGLCCALFASEFFIRFFYPEYVAAQTDKSFWHYDEVLGWKHRPRESGNMIIVDRQGKATSVRIAINGQGFRDQERMVAKAKGKYRIACLGDSFVFGYGVPVHDTFTQRMEELNRRLEVLNWGVSGYSTDQEVLLLDILASIYQPDAILLFFTNNDVEANNNVTGHGYPKPRFEFLNRKLVLTNVPVPDMLNRISVYSLDNYMRKHSAFYCFLRFRLSTRHVHFGQWLKERFAREYQGPWDLKSRSNGAYRDLAHLNDQSLPTVRANTINPFRPNPEIHGDMTVTLALLDRFVERSTRAGVKPVVVLFPDYYPIPISLEQDRIKAIVRDYLAGKGGCQVINLLPAFQSYAGDVQDLFLPDQHHWTAKGHEIIASELMRQLFAGESIDM